MATNGASPIIIHLMRLTIFASASFFGIRYDWTRLMMLIATTSISSTQPYGVMTSGTKSSGAIEYNTAIAIQTHAPACGETLFSLDKVSVLLVIIFVVFSLRGQRYGERLPKGGNVAIFVLKKKNENLENYKTLTISSVTVSPSIMDINFIAVGFLDIISLFDKTFFPAFKASSSILSSSRHLPCWLISSNIGT